MTETIDPYEIESIDWTDYKATYTPDLVIQNREMFYASLASELGEKLSIDGTTVTLDLNRLDFKTDIIDEALNQPLQTVEFIQRLAQHEKEETNKKHYVNLIGEAPNSEISERNVGRVISISGYVEHITGKQSRKIKVPWFCKSGHCTERIYRRGEKIDKPLKCDYVNEDGEECKANPYKQATNKMQAIKYGYKEVSPFTAQIQQTVIKIPKEEENSESRIKGEWDKPHINKVDEGQTVDVVGILRHEESKDESQDYYIHILGIENEDKEKELTSEERKEVKEWVQDSTLKERVMKIDKYNDDRFNPRLAVLCSIVKGNHGKNDNIHTLLVGPAGTGKTELGDTAVNLIEDGEKVEMQKSSKSGIVGSVVKREMLDGENWTVQHGTLARASGGSVLVDEMDKVKRAGKINILSETMESQTASIEKVADKTLQTDVSIIGTCNPVDRWGKKDTKLQALPSVFQSHILDRFDLIIWMEKEKQSPEEKGDRYLGGDNPALLEKQRIFKKWIQYAKEKEPEFKRQTEGFEELKNCFSLTNSTSNRTENTIANLSQAVSKLNLNDTVQKQDVEEAWDLWTDYKNEMENIKHGNNNQ